MKIRKRLLASGLLALAAGSAQAGLVTFDLSVNASYYPNAGYQPGEYVWGGFDSYGAIYSDQGTTAELAAFSSGGNLQTVTRDSYGAGTYHWLSDSGASAVFTHSNANDWSSLYIVFPDEVQLVSIAFNVLATTQQTVIVTPNGGAHLGVQSLGTGTGTFPPPPPVVLDYTSQFVSLRNVSISPGAGGWISVASITVNDPSVSVPVPATLPLLGFGILGIAAVRRRNKSA